MANDFDLQLAYTDPGVNRRGLVKFQSDTQRYQADRKCV
jgi:hypothetical protein